MAQDVSIAFRASDNLSNSIRQMQRNVGGLSRDVSEYRRIQDQTFNKKVEIKYDIQKAKQELRELTKAVNQNVEGAEQAFKEKQLALERLNEEYRRLTQVARDASKAERQLQDDISRSSNTNTTRASGLANDINQSNGMLKALAGAGLGNMLGQSVSNNLNSTISSMFGANTGSAISGIAGGVTSGAAMGSIAGAPGAAIGAAIGGLTGAINALTDKQQREDDYLRTEVKDLYNNSLQVQKASLTNGIELAGKREQDMISFSTILHGEDNADRFLKDVQAFAAKTPFETNNLLDTSKVMLSYGYGQDEIIPMMTKIGDASSALGIDSANQQVVATALGRMKSSGKTSLEYINQLTERAIPAIDYLAKALGTTNDGIYNMISKGSIDGAKASKIILDAMGEQFEGNMAKQSATYEGLASSLSDTWAQIDQAMGVGYTEERKKGMESELNQLDGIIGEQMKEANNLIGQFQADLENQYQQSIIDATTSAMDTDEYKKAMEEGNGAEMGRIIAAARAEAEIQYKNGEEYQLKLQAEKGLVSDIQDALVSDGDYVKFGEIMAEQFSLGWSGIVKNAISSSLETGQYTKQFEDDAINNHGSWWQKTLNNMENTRNTNFSETPTLWDLAKLPGNGDATGLQRVPSDGLYKLHEGEKVKTKVESNKEDNAKSSPIINITVNNNGRDMYEITNEVCRQIIEASENFANVG